MDFNDDRSVASARTEEVIRPVPRAPLRDTDNYDLRADTANHQVPPTPPTEADLGFAQESGDSVQSAAEFAPDGVKFRPADGTGATALNLRRGEYAAADPAPNTLGDKDVSSPGPSAMGPEAVPAASGEALTGAANDARAEGLTVGGGAGVSGAGGGALGDVENPGPLLRVVRRQELAFAVVGGFNTALGIGMTVVWLAVLGDNVPPSVAVAAAYGVSIAVAFVLHRTLVFRVRGHLLRDFLRFVAVNSGGLLLNMVLLELAVSVWHFPDKPAAVVVMGLVAVASYFGHRHISFHRRPAVESRDVVG
ncbi:GtrA family protein [Nocardia brasiliensis]|uniref:GtrA family protein n=1 Tax=Nocardia brasiliensis TaxID=37326 RepID=UPI002453C59F|nr:GtrA family protein [Nocardia brasiliensis]